MCHSVSCEILLCKAGNITVLQTKILIAYGRDIRHFCQRAELEVTSGLKPYYNSVDLSKFNSFKIHKR